MKEGHHFHSKHGFTGSAHPGKEHRPSIPGFKRGGEVVEGAKEHFGKKSHKDHDGESHHADVHYDRHGFQMHKKGGKVTQKQGESLDSYDGCD